MKSSPKRKPRNCPECGDDRIVPIVYGLPDRELERAWERGKIQLGGCIIFEDQPEWHCKKCAHQWR